MSLMLSEISTFGSYLIGQTCVDLPERVPVEDLGDELEVGLLEVLHGDDARVAEGAHLLAEVSDLDVGHWF